MLSKGIVILPVWIFCGFILSQSLLQEVEAEIVIRISDSPVNRPFGEFSNDFNRIDLNEEEIFQKKVLEILITGKIKKPGFYSAPKGITLFDVFYFSGGFDKGAIESRIYILNLRSKKVFRINLDGENDDIIMKRILLEDHDIIRIDEKAA